MREREGENENEGEREGENEGESVYSLMVGSFSGQTWEDRYVKPSGRYEVAGSSLSTGLKSYV